MRNPELAAAMIAVLATSAWYGFIARHGAPSPAGAIGYALGISGLVLMLAAEFLYTLRKRRRDASWGPTRTWLAVHVFIGLVGPWLVLLHTAGRFNGLAGVAAGLTILIVVSGFVGRFIYTATPRSLDGAVEDLQRLESKLAALELQLPGLGIDPKQPGPWTLATETPPAGWFAVVGRHLLIRRKRREIQQALAKLRLSRASIERLSPLLIERYRLWLQMHSLAAARRLLALWQLFHVPLGAALFVMAFAHVGGALYYGALSK